MRWLRVVVIVTTVIISFGYGRYVIASGADPLDSLGGPYLIGYGIAPLLCVLGVGEAWSTARDLVLVRSGSVGRWWRQRMTAGVAAAAQVALSMIVGTMAARFGLPIATVGQVIGSGVAPVIVILGIAVIGYGLAALAALMNRTSLIVAALAWWVAVVVAGRRAESLAVWGNPSRVMMHPADTVHLVWPVLLMGVAGHAIDLIRQGRWQVVVRPAVVYGVVGVACLVSQAVTGNPVAQADGGELAVHDPVRQVLSGAGAGGGMRQLLFLIIIWLGYPAAFAADLAAHRQGPWQQELIRAGGVVAWCWRRSWPWLLGALAVPLVGLAMAQLAAWLLPSTTELSVNDVVHVISTGTLQLIVYLLVVLIVHLLHFGSAGPILVLVGLSVLFFARHAGVPVPIVATNGLPSTAGASAIVVCSVLAVAAVVLAAGVGILARHFPPEWSFQS